MTKGPWKKSAYQTSVRVPPVVKPKTVARTTGPSAQPTKATDIETTARTRSAESGKERLQKILARAGIASRRNAEILILEGAVTVNGRVVSELGTKADPEKDKIKVNGKLIFTEVEPSYIALYKPKGVISSLADPEGRRHLGLLLKGLNERVIPVGRLDYNSEGLMLLTNDGAIADQVIKARNLPKVYMVKIKGHPGREELEFLKNGFFTAEGVVRFASFGVEQSLRSKSWLKLEVIEGSGLDLRELLNRKGLLVDRIVRTAIGDISIQGLEPGEYRLLKRKDFERLLELSALQP
ncbi:MAG: pseudouridine synthase [Bdellovibrionota bacterium]